MAKIIAEKTQENESQDKFVEIKHLQTRQDAEGNDLQIVDWIEIKEVNQAISDCETHKANLESQLTECESELADFIAIRDAE
tara:strand:- start:3652 stop:3897 length:246 start_codon:yes stop_codon:yes gene_type:complete